MNVTDICADPFQSRFAVIARVQRSKKKSSTVDVLLEYNPRSLTPEYEMTMGKGQRIFGLSYFPSKRDNEMSVLGVLDQRASLLTPGDTSSFSPVVVGDESDRLVPLYGSQSSKAYEQIFGQKSEDSEVEKPVADFGNFELRGEDPASALFDVPAHVLPPMDTVASKFIDTLLRKRSKPPDQGANVEVTDSMEDGGDYNSGVRAEHDGIAVQDSPSLQSNASVNVKNATVHHDEPSVEHSTASEMQFLVDFFQRGKVPVFLVPTKKEKKRKRSKSDDPQKNSSASVDDVPRKEDTIESKGGPEQFPVSTKQPSVDPVTITSTRKDPKKRKKSSTKEHGDTASNPSTPQTPKVTSKSKRATKSAQKSGKEKGHNANDDDVGTLKHVKSSATPKQEPPETPRRSTRRPAKSKLLQT